MILKHIDRLDSLRLRRRPVYEPAETGFVRDALRPGQTFVDVGAHIGYYTTLAAEIAGSSGRVIAFEPLPELAALLEANVRDSGFGNVEIVRKAVSDAAGRARLYLNPGNTGDNRLFRTPGWQSVKVECVRLDNVLSWVDFLKIDMQGFEWRVIRGGSSVITRCRPAIILEYYPIGVAASGGDEHAMVERLFELGYRAQIADPAGLLPFSWRLLDAKANRRNRRHRNLIFRRRE